MELVIAFIIIAVVCVVFFGLFVWDMSKKNKTSIENAADAETKPRLSLPTDSNVYVFKLDNELKLEEWELLFNAGWNFVTSNMEQYETYVGCWPDAPKVHRTRWHYVFRKEIKHIGQRLGSLSLRNYLRRGAFLFCVKSHKKS